MLDRFPCRGPGTGTDYEKRVNGTRNSVRKFHTGKWAHLFRFSTFSGNFPVGRTDETCSIYRRTGNSENFDLMEAPRVSEDVLGHVVANQATTPARRYLPYDFPASRGLFSLVLSLRNWRCFVCFLAQRHPRARLYLTNEKKNNNRLKNRQLRRLATIVMTRKVISVRNFIILQSVEGLTSFDKNNRSKKFIGAVQDVYFSRKGEKNIKFNLVLVLLFESRALLCLIPKTVP